MNALEQYFLTRVRPNPKCSTELSLGFSGSPSKSQHFQGRTQEAACHLILGGKLNVERRDNLFLGLHLILGENWTSEDVMTFFLVFT